MPEQSTPDSHVTQIAEGGGSVTFDSKFTKEPLPAHFEEIEKYTVCFKIPCFAHSPRRLQNPATGEEYSQIGFCVGPKKYINFFCYFPEQAVKPDKVLIAKATILVKYRDGGDRFLCADLHPYNGAPEYIISAGGAKWLKAAQDNTIIHEAFPPMPGGIVLTPR